MISTYLDAATAAPLHPVAVQALQAASADGWADHTRLYSASRRARQLLDAARETVAEALGARPDEVRFTPSGTQAVHAGVLGALSASRRRGNTFVHSDVEHSSVLHAGTWHAHRGGTTAAAPVTRTGRLRLDGLDDALDQPGVALVAVQSANHEVGTVQPLAEVAERCGEVPLLVDAAQSVGRMDVPAWSLLCASARKWGGPAGVGVLAVRAGVSWHSPWPEDSHAPDAPGALNLPAVVAAAAALRAVMAERDAQNARQRELTARLRRGVADIPYMEVVGDAEQRLPHIVTFSYPFEDAQPLMHELDRRGFAVSAGSSCTSSTLSPSHVLENMGVLSHGNIRVSLHSETTEDDIDRFLPVLSDVVTTLREDSGATRLLRCVGSRRHSDFPEGDCQWIVLLPLKESAAHGTLTEPNGVPYCLPSSVSPKCICYFTLPRVACGERTRHSAIQPVVGTMWCTNEVLVTNLKIRKKVALLVTVPLIAAVVFAALTVVTTGGDALQSERVRMLVIANDAAGDVAHRLQTERSLAVQTLLEGSPDGVAEDFLNHQKDTDTAIDEYQSAVKDLTGVPNTTKNILERIDTELGDLKDLRKRTSKREQAASSVAFKYRITIADLLSYRESVPQAGNLPSDVADRVRASNLLTRAAEYQSIQCETVLRAMARGKLSADAFQKIAAANTGSTEALLSFDALAPAKWRDSLEVALSGDKVDAAAMMEDEALRAQPGEKLEISPSKWADAMRERATQYQIVQDPVDDQIVEEITQLRNEQYQWTFAQLGGVLLAVIIALILAVWLGGPVVRGLRRLRDTAHHVATEGLPRAVAQLDDHTELGNQTPEEFAGKATPPVAVKGRDELADVGRAFNEVHQEAIRVAAHQALLRLHIGGMFVRLARRGHSLAGRLTNVLDEAERDEQDPDRLDRLFKLDHLVTLFGRTNDSLLVLGGAAPARARRSNETIGNVVTAAQSQIEQYTRVQVGPVDEGVSVKAIAVDDTVKLLAELLDNATQFSQHQVNVTARLLSDRLIIQISDRGIGMPPERIKQLNSRLASRNPLDLDSFQTMGLTVVGHIASQHHIEVELRAAAVGGTLVEVSLPVDVIEVESQQTEIPTAPEPAPLPSGPREAPLFKRREKKSTSEQADTKASKKKLSKSKKRSPAAEAQPATAGSPTISSAGLPRIQFDFASIPVDPGRPPSDVNPQGPPTAEQPAIPRQRRMNVNGLQSFNSGWQAAEQATAVADTVEDDGLPKREPMSRLVPGAVDPTTTGTPADDVPVYRDPVSVGAAYVAFAKTRPNNQRS